MAEQADHDGAVAYALVRLRNELPPYLTFHNAWHTEEDVLPAAVRLAQLCGVADADTRLLRTAAAYHDLGYIEDCAGHEEISARLAAQALPRYHFSPSQIETITGLILATRVPQFPSSLLEEILVDADLDVLGRDDFFERNEALRRENIILGGPIGRLEWLESQLQFMEGHMYFTEAARDLREATKQKHLAALRQILHPDG